MSRRGRVRRWTAVGATAAILLLVPAQLASAHETGHGRDGRGPASFTDQEVVELDAGDSGSRGASGLEYHQSAADAVTATNAAVAYAACDGCRAVALSFQVAVADGAPHTLDVGNVAVAMTEGCEGCEAVAVAYQLVVASGTRLRLTGQGRAELAGLRRDLRRLARSDLSPEELQARADDLMAAAAATVSEQLRARVRVRCDRDVEQGPPQHHRHPRVPDRRAGQADRAA